MKAECSCRSEFLNKCLKLVPPGFSSIFAKDHFCNVWAVFSVLSSQVMN